MGKFDQILARNQAASGRSVTVPGYSTGEAGGGNRTDGFSQILARTQSASGRAVTVPGYISTKPAIPLSTEKSKPGIVDTVKGWFDDDKSTPGFFETIKGLGTRPKEDTTRRLYTNTQTGKSEWIGFTPEKQREYDALLKELAEAQKYLGYDTSLDGTGATAEVERITKELEAMREAAGLPAMDYTTGERIGNVIGSFWNTSIRNPWYQARGMAWEPGAAQTIADQYIYTMARLRANPEDTILRNQALELAATLRNDYEIDPETIPITGNYLGTTQPLAKEKAKKPGDEYVPNMPGAGSAELPEEDRLLVQEYWQYSEWAELVEDEYLKGEYERAASERASTLESRGIDPETGEYRTTAEAPKTDTGVRNSLASEAELRKQLEKELEYAAQWAVDDPELAAQHEANARRIEAQLGGDSVGLSGKDKTVGKREPYVAESPLIKKAEEFYAKSDAAYEKGAEQYNEAVYGQSDLGKLGVDLAQGAMGLGVDALANRLLPGVGGKLGLGTRVYFMEAAEARRNGDDFDTQVAKGMTAALIEVGTEMIGGPFGKIYGKSGLSKITARVTKNPAVKLILDSLEEGGEEGLAAVAELAVEHLAGWDDGKGSFADDFKEQKDDILYEMLVAGILGGFGSGTEQIAEGFSADAANRAMVEYIEANIPGGVKTVVRQGVDSAKGTTANKLGLRNQGKVDAGKLKPKDVAEQYKANAELVALEEETTRITDDASIRLTELGEPGDIPALSAVIAKATTGQKLTADERKILLSSRFGVTVRDESARELRRRGGIKKSPDSSDADIYANMVEQRLDAEEAAQKEAEGISLAEQTAAQQPAQTFAQTETETRAPTQAPAQTTAEQQSTEQRQTPAEPQNVGDGGGAVTVGVKSAGGGGIRVSPKVAGLMTAGQNKEAFDAAATRAYRAGLFGMDIGRVETGDNLTEEQRKAAYELGAEERRAKTERNKGKAGEGAKAKGKGGVQGYNISLKELRKSFNDAQNQAYRSLDRISRATGLKIMLYDSSKVEGELAKADGMFEWDGDTLYIDVAAGLDPKKHNVKELSHYTMNRAFGHEFGHFMEKWDAEGYEKLRAYVFDYLAGKGVDVDALIDKAMAMYGLDEEAASREVMANGLADILPQSDFIERLYNQDRTLWEKIVGELKKFVANLKAQFAQMDADSRTKTFMEDGVNYAEDLLKMWTDVAEKAVKNYQAAGGKPNSANTVKKAGGTKKAPVSRTSEEKGESNIPEEAPRKAAEFAEDDTAAEITETIAEEAPEEKIPKKEETEKAKEQLEKAIRFPILKRNEAAIISGLERGELNMDTITLPGTVPGFNTEQRVHLVEEIIKAYYAGKKMADISVPYDGKFTIRTEDPIEIAKVLSRLKVKVTQEVFLTESMANIFRAAGKNGRARYSTVDGQPYLTDGSFLVPVDKATIKDLAILPISEGGFDASLLSGNGSIRALVNAEYSLVTENPEYVKVQGDKRVLVKIDDAYFDKKYVSQLDGGFFYIIPGLRGRQALKTTDKTGNVIGYALAADIHDAKITERKPSSLKSFSKAMMKEIEGHTQYSLKSGVKVDKVNQSMTMQRAADMVQRAFNLADIRDWFDGEYKTGLEWLKGEGAESVAVVIENDYNMQLKYLNNIPEYLNEEIYLEDILEAYAAGTLTGKDAKPKTKRLDTKQSTGYADSRFYAPKQYSAEEAAALFETASQKVTKKNREEVNKARAALLFLAHDNDVSSLLGISKAEFNKKLRTWSAYSKTAMDISQRINSGVPVENRWTGIQNCSIINKQTVSDADILEMVKEIRGKSEEHQRQYIARTMLALDTHIDWSRLSFAFKPGRLSGNARGMYADEIITIGGNGYANTVAHEMGHALDDIWGRDILGSRQHITESSRSPESISDPDIRQFFVNFRAFLDSITDAADIRSDYTQRNTEVFARFVAKFVEFADQTAGNTFYQESSFYSDRFTSSHYIEFAKLLQEKAMLDGKRAQQAEGDVERQVQYARKSDRPERRRALRKGEMVNPFHSALSRQEWYNYYQQVRYDRRNPDLYEDGDMTIVLVGDKLLVLEMRPNGEFEIILVCRRMRKSAQNPPQVLPFLSILDDLLEEVVNDYRRTEISSWLSVIAGDDGEEVYAAYNKHSGQYEINAQESENGNGTVTEKSGRARHNGESFLEVSSERSPAGRESERDISNAEVGEEQFSRKEPRMSDLEVLEKAANELPKNSMSEEEQKTLDEFKRRLDKLRELQQQRRDLGKLYKEQMFTKGGNRAEAEKTHKRMGILDQKIKAAENALLGMKNRETIKAVLKKGRKVVEAEQKARDDAKLQAFRANRDESDKRRKYKQRVEETAREIMDWLTKPDSKDARKRVPLNLQNALLDLLKSIDFSSASLLRGKGPTQKDLALWKKLEAVQNAVKANIEAVGAESGMADMRPEFQAAYEALMKKVLELSASGEGYVLNRMSGEELKELSGLLKELKHYVVTANTFVNNATFSRVGEAGRSSISHMKGLGRGKSKGIGGAIGRFFSWNNMRPAYVFPRFGKGGESIYEEFREGQSKQARLAKYVQNFAEATFTPEQAKKWANTYETFEIDGERINIPITHLMSLYCLNKRPQAITHLLGGGIRVAKSKGVAEADTDSVAGGLHIGKMVEALNKYPEAKAVADKLQMFMSTECAKWGNEVDMARFGVPKFVEKNYFPINTDGRYLAATADEAPAQASLYALLNAPFTKAVNEKADQRLILYNIFDVFANHAASMIQYRAYALPTLDALKWFNYTDENGMSVREAMALAFGSGDETGTGSGQKSYAESFVINLIRSYNGTNGKGDIYESLGQSLMGNFNRAQVAFNLRTIIQQPTSIFRASLVLPYKSIMKGLGMSAVQLKSLAEEMEKYSGIALWKSMGFYDVNISRGLAETFKQEGDWRQKLTETGMKGAELADRYTWAAMWYAAKDSVSRAGKTDEQYFAEVTRIFEEAIYKTQVVDSVLTKAETQRATGFFAKSAMAFMSEPIAALSMLTDAVFKFDLDSRRYGRAGAWQKNKGYMGKVFVAYTVASVLNAAAQAIIDAYRDDDEYEDWWEKYTTALKGNVKDELNPLRKMPLVNDMVSLVVDGYEPTSDWAGWTTYISKGVKAMKDATDGDGKGYTLWGGIYNVMRGVSGALGAPLANISREGVDLWNHVVTPFKPNWKLKTYDPGVAAEIKYAYQDGYISAEEAQKLLVEEGATKAKEGEKAANESYWMVQGWDGEGKYDDLKEAVIAGDRRAFEQQIERLTSHGVFESYIYSEARDIIKEQYLEGEMSFTAVQRALINYGDRDEESAEDQAWRWRFEKETGYEWGDTSYSEGIQEALAKGDISRRQAIDWYAKGCTSTHGSMEEAEKYVRVLEWRSTVAGAEKFNVTGLEKWDKYGFHTTDAGLEAEDFIWAWQQYNEAQAQYDAQGKQLKEKGDVFFESMYEYYRRGVISFKEFEALVHSFYSDSYYRKYKFW